jgi:hypothetical protein
MPRNRHQFHRYDSWTQTALTPNPSLKASANSMPPGPRGATSFILLRAGLPSRCWRRLSSNVRPHRTEVSERLLSCEFLSAGFCSARKVRTKRQKPNGLRAVKYRHLRTPRIQSAQPRRACRRRFAPCAEAQCQSVEPPKGGKWQGSSSSAASPRLLARNTFNANTPIQQVSRRRPNAFGRCKPPFWSGAFAASGVQLQVFRGSRAISQQKIAVRPNHSLKRRANSAPSGPLHFCGLSYVPRACWHTVASRLAQTLGIARHLRGARSVHEDKRHTGCYARGT